MALIKSFIKGTGNVSKKFSDVECIYNTGYVDDEKFVTLSTYGSNTRQNSNSPSQVLHIDKASAEEIVKILKNEFGL